MRSTISSSRLVRLLGEQAPVDAPGSGPDFAERLSQWLGAVDAIGLHAGHQSILALGREGSAPKARRPGRAALRAHLDRVRSELVQSFTEDRADPEADADHASYLQRHLEHQRQMELRVTALRMQVRQAVAAASTRLRQLAALDALLEQVFGEREQKLLARVPVLLERRFRQLREAHGLDDPATWRQPGGWLAVFGAQWREALTAELDLRLQPVVGLIEAFDNGVETQP